MVDIICNLLCPLLIQYTLKSVTGVLLSGINNTSLPEDIARHGERVKTKTALPDQSRRVTNPPSRFDTNIMAFVFDQRELLGHIDSPNQLKLRDNFRTIFFQPFNQPTIVQYSALSQSDCRLSPAVRRRSVRFCGRAQSCLAD